MEDKKKLMELLKERFGDSIDIMIKQFAPRSLCVITVEEKVAILRPITATEVGQYSLMLAQGDLAEAARYLLNALWIEGDDIIRDDEEYFIAAMLQIQNLIEAKKSSFTKL